MHQHYRTILKSLDGCQCIHLTSIHWHAALLPLICIKLKIARLFDVWACRSPHVENESKMPTQLAIVDTNSVIIISLDYVTLIFLLGIWIWFDLLKSCIMWLQWCGEGKGLSRKANSSRDAGAERESEKTLSDCVCVWVWNFVSPAPCDKQLKAMSVPNKHLVLSGNVLFLFWHQGYVVAMQWSGRLWTSAEYISFNLCLKMWFS